MLFSEFAVALSVLVEVFTVWKEEEEMVPSLCFQEQEPPMNFLFLSNLLNSSRFGVWVEEEEEEIVPS